jgi:hypothetical protein
MVDIRYRNWPFVFHELPFPVHALRGAVAHHTIIVIKDWIHWKGPSMHPRHSKNIFQRDGLFIGLVHGVGGFLLEAVDRSNSSHETITYIHKHRRGEQEGPDAQQRHDADKMNYHWMKGTSFIRTKEVVPTKESQGVGRTSPCVKQKENKVLYQKETREGRNVSIAGWLKERTEGVR